MVGGAWLCRPDRILFSTVSVLFFSCCFTLVCHSPKVRHGSSGSFFPASEPTSISFHDSGCLGIGFWRVFVEIFGVHLDLIPEQQQVLIG